MAGTTEILALASAAVQVTRNAASSGFELQNLGPNAIWASLGPSSACVVNKCRKIAAGGSWSMQEPATVPLWVIASTADQVTGAATILSEAF